MNRAKVKKTFAVVVVVACLSLCMAGTLAYFTDEKTAHNVVTSGGIGIQIIEKQATDDGALVDFPKEGISGVMPGDSVSKLVSIENTDKGSAWVRARVSESILGASGEQLPTVLPSGELTDDGAPAGGTPVMSYKIADVWLAGGDGWYYYWQPVLSGSSTSNLIESVDFSPLMGNEYQNCTANVVVEAQAVQVANNPAPNGDVTKVTGWPAAEGASGASGSGTAEGSSIKVLATDDAN